MTGLRRLCCYRQNKMSIETIKNPKFNASIQYLDRLGALITHHHGLIVMQDWESLYLITNEIHNELLPRLDEKQVEKVEMLHKKCKSLWRLKVNKHTGFNEYTYIDSLNDWFKNLMLYAHRQGLIMEDKPDSMAFEL